MNWENNNKGHQADSNYKPLKKGNATYNQEEIHKELNTDNPNIQSASGWKCQNCGNTISGPFAPSSCPVCNAQDSYVPIH